MATAKRLVTVACASGELVCVSGEDGSRFCSSGGICSEPAAQPAPVDHPPVLTLLGPLEIAINQGDTCAPSPAHVPLRPACE
jgi:hypothetical protein